MNGTNVRESGEFLLIARRNNSLSAAGGVLVLGSLVFISLAIALAVQAAARSGARSAVPHLTFRSI